MKEYFMQRMKSREIWYGIIDGNHTWLVLIEFCSGHKEHWYSFQWRLTRLASNLGLLFLRQLDRSISDAHNENEYIEFTLFDKLYGMKQEYDLLSGARGNRRPYTGMNV